MAQSKQPVPGTAGYSPQQGHAVGTDAPVDPRYQQAYPNQDPANPADPRAFQAQQHPQTQSPQDYHYPQQHAQPGQQALDPYNTQPAPGPAGVHPDGGPAQSAYAPQFAPYTQPQAAEPHQQPMSAQPQQQFEGVQQPLVNNPAFPNQQQAYGDPAGQYAQPQNPHAPYQGAPDQTHAPQQPAPTYEEWPNTAPPQQDAHGYDVGGFQHADPHTGAPGSQPVYADDPSLQPYGELAAGGQVEPTYDDEEYDDHEEVDGSSGSRRIMMIVGALVGAIAVGGSLAYGYKAMTGSQNAKLGKTPVVRSAQKPSKARPSDPGGRQFDHTDSKIMGRLGQAGASTTASTDANGTRRVPTVIVGSDGSIQAPTVAPTPTGPAPKNPVVSVPGLTVVDAFRGQPGTAPTGAITATNQPLVVKPPTGPDTKRPRVQIRNAPKKPIVVSKASPTPPAVTKPKATAPAVRVPPVAKKKAPVKTATAPVASSSGAGFVAVLASVPVSKSSRMSALMQYADLQQKYASVLSNKTPDVVEANLGSKGKYHRLLVGPPGSRQQASTLCSQLKSAGYSGCWVTSY